MARNPITWDTAFLRVIIMRNASRMQAVAIPSVLLVMVPANWEIGAARVNARITSTVPTSKVAGVAIMVSTSQRTLKAWIRRYMIQGSRSTLRENVRSAE